MQTRSRIVVAASLVVGLLSCSVGAALANWEHSTAVMSPAFTTASVVPATDVVATGRCSLIILRPEVSLSWVPSATAVATGYEVRRSRAGNPFTTVATLPGRDVNAFRDIEVSGGATYTYVIRAVRGGWAADSAEVTTTTPLLCL
jgi:hypothetical protein